MQTLLKKEPTSSLAETDDRHTKKVKIRGNQGGGGDGDDAIMDQEGEDMDVQMENIEVLEANPGWKNGMSFKEKLMGKDEKDLKQRKSIVDTELEEQCAIWL